MKYGGRQGSGQDLLTHEVPGQAAVLRRDVACGAEQDERSAGGAAGGRSENSNLQPLTARVPEKVPGRRPIGGAHPQLTVCKKTRRKCRNQ